MVYSTPSYILSNSLERCFSSLLATGMTCYCKQIFMGHLGDFIQPGFLLWQHAFLPKILLAYLIFRGMGIYALGGNLFFRLFLTCLIFLFPQFLRASPLVLIPVFLAIAPGTFLRKIMSGGGQARYSKKIGRPQAFFSLLNLGLLVFVEWGMFAGASPLYPSKLSFLVWICLLMPPCLYGLSIEMARLKMPSNISGAVDPIQSLRQIFLTKEPLSLAISAYQWLFLGVAILAGNFEASVYVIIAVFLLLFVSINLLLKNLAVRLLRKRVKRLLMLRKRRGEGRQI